MVIKQICLMSIMRAKISDGVLERLRKYVLTKEFVITNLPGIAFPHKLVFEKGKTPSYGMTVDEAIDQLLKEAGF